MLWKRGRLCHNCMRFVLEKIAKSQSHNQNTPRYMGTWLCVHPRHVNPPNTPDAQPAGDQNKHAVLMRGCVDICNMQNPSINARDAQRAGDQNKHAVWMRGCVETLAICKQPSINASDEAIAYVPYWPSLGSILNTVKRGFFFFSLMTQRANKE